MTRRYNEENQFIYSETEDPELLYVRPLLLGCDATLDDIYDIEIYDTDSNVRVCYRTSPLTYVGRVLGDSKDDNEESSLDMLTKAIYLYQQAAYTYTLNLAHDEWETDIL